MNTEDYPALYRSADESSVDAQVMYLRLIKLQYALLLAASVVAIGFGNSPNLYVLYAVIVTSSTALLIYLSVKKPEKDWYGCRALAESIKTSTWRYMMRASPFDDRPSIAEVRKEFADFLQAILDANTHIREPISRRPNAGEQITQIMDRNRGLSLQERKELYRKARISEQRSWYVRKAKWNRRWFVVWAIGCVVVQLFAVLLVLLRLRYDQQWELWPTEPLLVLASIVIGWIQIKKFNELASAYNLAAHEIGIIETRIAHVADGAEFSEFVNEAERAFSREHTQWVARQVEPF